MVYLHLNILHLYSVCKLRYIVTFCDLFYSSSPYVWLLGWTVFHCSVCCVPDFVFSAAFYWKSVFFSGNGESLSLRSTCIRCSSLTFSLCVGWWHVKLDALASYGTIYIGREEIYKLTDQLLLKLYLWASIRQDRRRRDRTHIERKRLQSQVTRETCEPCQNYMK